MTEDRQPTELYIKPTYLSSHPNHTKNSITQTLLLNRFSFQESDFVKHMREMKSWFLKQRYPERYSFFKTEMEKLILGEN